jgi:hypothetical protein
MNATASNMIKYLFLIVTFGGFLSTLLVAAANAGQSVSTQLGAVCGDIETFIGVLVVMLLGLGAVLYAISYVLPAGGNIKGNVQGWALNMVVGAVAGLVIYFLAPWIATQIVYFGTNAGTQRLLC